MSRIGIIGSGNIGGALTRLFIKVGHDVAVANSRGPASLAEFAAETGARAATVEEVINGSEIGVVAVPTALVKKLPRALFHAAPANLIVIDTSNYYPQQRDGSIREIETGAPKALGSSSNSVARSSRCSTRSLPRTWRAKVGPPAPAVAWR